MRRVVAALAAVVVLAGCSVINYDTNQARKAAGLPEVAWDDSLAGCAHRHNVLMAMFGYGHSSDAEMFACVPLAYTTCAENIGNWPAAQDSTVDRTDPQLWFNAWWNSPGHRANILQPWARAEGDDIFVAPSGTVYGTQLLCT